MGASDLHDEIGRLERRHLDPAVRSSVAELDDVLADDLPMPISVRRANLDDEAALTAIRRDAILALAAAHMGERQARTWADGSSTDRVRRAIERHEVWVAESDGIVVAWVEIDEGRVEALYVRPDFACRGVGTILLRHAEDRIRAAGHETATLEASPNAEAFYTHRGYQLQSRSRGETGGAMLKQLREPEPKPPVLSEPSRSSARRTIRLQRYTSALRVAFVGWMHSDPTAQAFIGKSFPSAADDPERLFDRFLQIGPVAPVHLAWAIGDDGAEPLGHLELKATAKVGQDELELVYIVREDARNRGVASEAVRLALTKAPVHSASAIVAFINRRNVASVRVIEKAGFALDLAGESGNRYRLPLARAAEQLASADSP